MARRSNKSIQEILGQSDREFISFDDGDKELDKKITLVTEDFTTAKYCEIRLRDRTRLSKENALTICNYIIDMKREINPRLNTIKTTIQFLYEFCKCVDNGAYNTNQKRFEDMTRDDILLFLDQCRNPENDDPMHKWINSYNSKRSVLFRFFKWLQYRNITGDPDKRHELFVKQRKPKCIQDIPRLKRKEISSYKPSDLWTPEDDLLFLKYVTNKRDRCYHTMARDLSARPHEILNLKIKDIVFKIVDKYQYAEVLVNGKTGSRHIPLIQSIPYIKDWLSDHPSRNNPNSPIFVSMNNPSNGRRRLNISGLYNVYNHYKKVFFPKLLEDPTISSKEDKEKIKALLRSRLNSTAVHSSSMLAGQLIAIWLRSIYTILEMNRARAY